MASRSPNAWLFYIVERVLPRIRSDPATATAIALVIFGIALGLRFAIDHSVDQTLPFLTFFVGTLLATLVCGLIPGVVTLVLSFFAAWYFFLPPHYAFRADAGNVIALIAFGLQGALLVFVAHALNSVVERLTFERERGEELLERSARAESRLHDINGELRHRIKNVFSVISVLLSQSARYMTQSGDLVSSVTGRLRAMSGAQDLIAGNMLRGADLGDLIERTLQPLRPPGDARYSAAGPQLFLNADATTPLALILHELATNAIKHGAWSDDAGRVEIVWTKDGGAGDIARIELVWREKNGPEVSAPTRLGFGSVLIDRTFADAKVERAFNSDGVICRIAFAATPSQPEAKFGQSD